MNTKHCRHFNGVLGPGMRKDHKPCLVGLNFRDYNTDTGGRGLALACLSEGTIKCPKFDPYTQAEVDADEKEMQEWIKKTLGVRAAIIAGMEAVGAKSGEGECDCPACGTGRIHYHVTDYNGHIWARCSTKDCVNFME